tara:strand:- start:298 stop:519 length:222 start_codon:yes stop_codon:yes gene_type:complete
MEVLIFALVFGVAVGYWANCWGRNGWAWGIGAALFSPLVAGIILLFVGRTPELKAQQAAEHEMRVKTYMPSKD